MLQESGDTSFALLFKGHKLNAKQMALGPDFYLRQYMF